jgi:hypothetical protein
MAAIKIEELAYACAELLNFSSIKELTIVIIPQEMPRTWTTIIRLQPIQGKDCSTIPSFSHGLSYLS